MTNPQDTFSSFAVDRGRALRSPDAMFHFEPNYARVWQNPWLSGGGAGAHSGGVAQRSQSQQP